MSDPADVDPSGRSGEPGEVTVVGTAHVSEESAERVREEITDRKPHIVAVELDEDRYNQLKGGSPDDIEPRDMLRGNTVFQFLAYWVLSYVQQRMGERFGVEPGADMMAAVETAEEQGLGVALVDRDIQTTIQRFWKRLTFAEKLKMVGGLAFGATDPLLVAVGIGLGIGAFFGIVFGLAIAPLLGLGSAFALGITAEGTLALVGAVVGGAIGGVIVGGAVVPTVGGAGIVARSAGGALLGILACIALVLTTPDLPLVPGPGSFASVGDSAIRASTGLVAGSVLGSLGGVVLGVVAAAVLDDHDEVDAIDEEFDIEDLTDGDVVTAMMEEFRRFSPGGAEALIDERDAFIAHKLVALRDAGYDVVAVVGAGHREGIERYLEAPETLPPMESITGTESGRRFSLFKLFGYLVLIGFVAFFGLLALGGIEDRVLIQVFGAWFVFNGVFAFTAARLAGARLSSAGVGGAVAWMTSINPLLAPGWFAGFVELRHRPVNVGDIDTLNNLLDDTERPFRDVLADMLEVPLFRLIAVVAMTNVGSLIATLLFPIVVLQFFFEDVSTVAELGDTMVQGARNGFEILRGVLT